MANNIRDRVKDKESGRKTLPILLGKKHPSHSWPFYMSLHILL